MLFIASQHGVGMEQATGWIHRNNPDPVQKSAAWKWNCMNSHIFIFLVCAYFGKIGIILNLYSDGAARKTKKTQKTATAKH